MAEDWSEGKNLFQISIPKTHVSIATVAIIHVFFVIDISLMYIYYHTYL